jgi:adenylate cyclase
MAATTLDVAQLEAAGLYDPGAAGAAERLALLEWLVAQGATVDQMQEAARDGRLVSVAGDLAIRPGPRLTLEEVAARVGLPVDRVGALALATGAPPLDQRWFTEPDVQVLEAFLAGANLFGAKPIERFTRILGSSLARIAEAAVSLFAVNVEGPLLHTEARELERAQQGLRAVRSLDGLQFALGVLFRANMETAVRRQRRARSERSVDTLQLTVGFVDLVGFTSVSSRMTTRELAEVVERFEETAHDVVIARDGRLVKLIGDEVMFVAVEATAACDIALTLVERFQGDPAITPRGALTAGGLLSRGGDYYGPVVNLAARLADVAVPHELLVTPEVAGQAAGSAFRFEPAGRRMLKGFDVPVTLLTVERAGAV